MSETPRLDRAKKRMEAFEALLATHRSDWLSRQGRKAAIEHTKRKRKKKVRK